MCQHQAQGLITTRVQIDPSQQAAVGRETALWQGGEEARTHGLWKKGQGGRRQMGSGVGERRRKGFDGIGTEHDSKG